MTDETGGTLDDVHDRRRVTGIIGLDNATVGSKATINSWDSSVPYAATNSGVAGTTVSNGPISLDSKARIDGLARSTQGSITVAKNAILNGDAWAGTTITGLGKVTGNRIGSSPSPPLSASAPACGAFSSPAGLAGKYTYNQATGDLTVNKGTTTVAPGTYCFHNVTVTGASTLKPTGAVVLKLTASSRRPRTSRTSVRPPT